MDALHPDNAEHLLNVMNRMLDRSDRVEKLTDRELTAEIIEKVWGGLVLNSDEDWLLDQLVTRFEKRCGIERDENGEIVP